MSTGVKPVNGPSGQYHELTVAVHGNSQQAKSIRRSASVRIRRHLHGRCDADSLVAFVLRPPGQPNKGTARSVSLVHSMNTHFISRASTIFFLKFIPYTSNG
jgi:hypothetical protein